MGEGMNGHRYRSIVDFGWFGDEQLCIGYVGESGRDALLHIVYYRICY